MNRNADNIEERDLEKIIEEKVEQRVQEELKKRERGQTDTSGENKSEQMSRRNFLKRLGLGAAGAGALTLLPSASAFNIKSSNPIQYFNSSRDSNPNFKINQTGDINARDADLNQIIASRIEAGSELKIPTSNSTNNNNQVWIDTSNQELKVRYNDSTYRATLTQRAYENVIEDFETGSLGAWTSTSGLTVQSSTVAEGSYAVEISNPSNAFQAYSAQGDGLDYYPQKGDRFSMLMRESGSRLPTWNFGVDTSNSEGYYVFLHTQDRLEVGITSGSGSFTSLNTTSISESTDTWYEVEVQWHDGSGSLSDNTIEVTLYSVDTSKDLSQELGRGTELASVTAQDSTYASNRGIGIADGNNSSAPPYGYIDRVWHLGDVK